MHLAVTRHMFSLGIDKYSLCTDKRFLDAVAKFKLLQESTIPQSKLAEALRLTTERRLMTLIREYHVEGVTKAKGEQVTWSLSKRLKAKNRPGIQRRHVDIAPPEAFDNVVNVIRLHFTKKSLHGLFHSIRTERYSQMDTYPIV